MKLSEAQRAHDLVGCRRKLVRAYVEVGCTKEIDTGNFWGGRSMGPLHLFGFVVDGVMAAAVRQAVRAEIRRRIEEADALLGKLGVEVDGIEIAIRTEEQARNEGEPEEKAA